MKVVLSGASSGLGLALAEHYLSQGATVALIARRREQLLELETKWPGRAVAYGADVRDEAAMNRIALEFLQRFGLPDIVIANAGISIGNLTEYAEDIDVFQDVIDTNLMGMVKTFQPYLQAMKEAGRGKLVGVASVAGIRGLPGASAYSASKAAAISYLEGLRVELRGSGVEVLTLCPGYIDTPMTRSNPYPMPFILDAGSAAKNAARAIAAGKKYHVFPWQMSLVVKILNFLPRFIYDPLFSRAGRKPRLHRNPDSINS